MTSLKSEITSYSDNGYNVSDLFVPLKSLFPIKFPLERINTNLNKEKFSFFDKNLNQVFKKWNYFVFW